MEAWVGPAIVAAAISAVVTAFGWVAGYRREMRVEALRRREKVRDVQTALRAESRSFRYGLTVETLEADAHATVEKLRTAETHGKGFVPFVPQLTASFIFDAVAKEIYILPTTVIDPVVLHYKQVAALSAFIDDLRSDAFSSLSTERKIAMYLSYRDLSLYTLAAADIAIAALDRALASGEFQ